MGQPKDGTSQGWNKSIMIVQDKDDRTRQGCINPAMEQVKGGTIKGLDQ
jgi:hypothetical protein